MKLHFTSWLFTGADKPEMVKKAFKKDASFVVLDWEDAVAINKKSMAREVVKQLEKDSPGIQYGLRINAFNTQEALSDLQFILDNQLNPHVILLPKTNHEHEIVLLNQIINDHPGREPLLLTPIIETAEGVLRIEKIAKASPAVAAIIFGAADLAFDMNMALNWENFQFIRERLVLAASAAKIQAVDTTCFAINDEKQLQKECASAKAIGFTGKAAIHPAQIKCINETLRFTDEEVAQAEYSIKSMGQDNSVKKIYGALIGPPMLKRAEFIVKENAERGFDVKKK